MTSGDEGAVSKTTPQGSTPLEIVAKAIGDELVDQELAGADFDEDESNRQLAIAAFTAMRNHTLVYRDGGGVVHQLVGSPDDIWKTIIDGILAPPAENRTSVSDQEEDRNVSNG